MNCEYNQIVNLYKFNINFSKYNQFNFNTDNKIMDMSPDYIIEKYNHWIGFTPTVEYNMYTPDDMINFFHKYWKRWKSFDKYEKEVKNILMYLYSTQSLQAIEMFSKFEQYIGPVTMISDVANKRGLHALTEEFVSEVIDGNSENIKVILREMKLRKLI
jgi:hypothetical protein